MVTRSILPFATRWFYGQGDDLWLSMFNEWIVGASLHRRCQHDNHDLHRIACGEVTDAWKFKEG